VDWIERVVENTENGSVEAAELAGVREVRTSKKFGCSGAVTMGKGRNSEVTGDVSMMFTECQSTFCCSND
jgi:hypothetical protein